MKTLTQTGDESPQRPEVLEDIAPDGTRTGLEHEDPANDSGQIQTPFDPKQIDVITQQKTVDLLLNRLHHGEINLSPDFQRRANLWSAAQKSSLIESMLLRIPIPSLYVYEDAEGNYEVVDGLQRLCSIAHFIQVEDLNRALNLELEPLALFKLQSLGELGETVFSKLPRPLQRRLLETELTLHVIRAGTPPGVKFSIFARINRGGMPLTAQEIRNAVYKGPWREHVRKMASSEAFLKATGNAIKSSRQEDHELVLRFCAHFALGPGGIRNDDENLDDFLNGFVEKTSFNWSEKKWQELENSFYLALEYAPKIFGRHAFRKVYSQSDRRRPINKGLFESETVALAFQTPGNLEVLVKRSDLVMSGFIDELNRSDSLSSALLYATGRGSSSNDRLAFLADLFESAIDD